MVAQTLLAAGALVILVLGTAHLFMTFASNKFSPRDSELEARLKLVAPVISSQTTMWRAWVGFNASHSTGAVLFGLVYGYLAAFHFSFLVASTFLSLLGCACLVCYLVLAKLYWFSVPLVGIGLALGLYLAGLILAWT